LHQGTSDLMKKMYFSEHCKKVKTRNNLYNHKIFDFNFVFTLSGLPFYKLAFVLHKTALFHPETRAKDKPGKPN